MTELSGYAVLRDVGCWEVFYLDCAGHVDHSPAGAFQIRPNWAVEVDAKTARELKDAGHVKMVYVMPENAYEIEDDEE